MKTIRISCLILLLFLATLFFVSCVSDVTVYSPTSRVSIVKSDTDVTAADAKAYNDIVSTIQGHIGANCRAITDTLLQTNFEIVIGESNREITRLAKEFLENNTPIDEDTESYVFYYKDNAIAIVASSEFAMRVAVKDFVESYLSSDTLIIKSDLVDFNPFSKTAYLVELDAEIIAEETERWEHRWDDLFALLGTEGTEAVKRLYEFWGTEWLQWAVGLYDGELGGFYYSASARNYVGFSPDIESTDQMLNLLYEFGICDWYDGYWGEALPDDFRAKLASFVQNMQSEDDGYFYHPQWGKDIGTSARGRHLNGGIFILQVAGEAPLYLTPLERENTSMSGTSGVISAFMESEEHKSSVVFTASTLPLYMQSESALIDYLDTQWAAQHEDGGTYNSYVFGHLLSSQASQFEAAGVLNIVCDWLDSHQISDTGFWEVIIEENPDSAYRAISGLIKISTLYGAANRAFNHADEMVDVAIEIILSDVPPAHVCYIYNPIGAFNSIISSMERVGMDVTTAKQKFYYYLPRIISTTISKQEAFRKEYGSFSYLPDRSDPASQGLRLSLGLEEGDVNATAVSMHYIADALFGIFDMGIIPMFRYSDYKWFCEQVSESGAPVKQELLFEVLDFEDGDIPAVITVPEISDLEVDVVEGGCDSDKALFIHNSGSASAQFILNMDTTIEPTCTAVEFDMRFISSVETGYVYELFIMNSNKSRTGFHMQFNVTGSGTIEVHQLIYPNEEVYSDTIFTLPMDEWFKMRMEYYPISSDEMRVKIYIDGDCVYIGSTPHNNHYDQNVYNGMNRLYFNCFRGNELSFMIDNVDVNHDTKVTFDDSDYNR